MSREITNFINGQHVSAANGETTDLVDPSTGEPASNMGGMQPPGTSL